MKFMKLGSKPDAFQSDGNFIRYVASELAPDVIVVVGEVKFYLHKFPLLSKSNRLQTLISNESDLSCDTVELDDFPGGPKAFEICAKFCYGMTVTLNPYVVAGARCAAEYLEMTEDVERGNLVFKIEVFLNSSILRSWKDSIIVLQSTKSLLPWSKDLRLVARCVDSVASKISVDPTDVSWSYTCNRKLLKSSSVSASEIKTGSVPKDWWVEDICELEMDLYKRVINAVRSKGKTREAVIGEALRAYTARWVPDPAHSSAEFSESHKNLIETIALLLPPSGVGCSCNFLLRLLKFAILVDAEESVYEVLLESISTKIDEASVEELLIPARVPQAVIYDVELVKDLVCRFVSGGSEKGRGRSWMNLGKLMDGYLKEVARDPGLNLDGFVELIRCVPESARLIHDGLYAAIDIYLQEHPGITKAEKKKLCGQMDVRKLTTDAAMHAAQNERLPLRTVVQVLYFEQSRAAAGVQLQQQPLLTNSSSCGSDDSGGGGMAVAAHHHQKQQQLVVWEKEPLPDTRKFETDWTGVSDKYPPVTAAAQLAKNKSCKNRGSAAAQLVPSRSRRILDKIWAVRKVVGSGENRSSETSGSSQSPNSLLQGGGEANQSSGSSSRNRRHSIS